MCKRSFGCSVFGSRVASGAMYSGRWWGQICFGVQVQQQHDIEGRALSMDFCTKQLRSLELKLPQHVGSYAVLEQERCCRRPEVELSEQTTHSGRMGM